MQDLCSRLTLMSRAATKFGAQIVGEWAKEFELSTSGKRHRVKVGDKWYLANAVIFANGATAR